MVSKCKLQKLRTLLVKKDNNERELLLNDAILSPYISPDSIVESVEETFLMIENVDITFVKDTITSITCSGILF